MTKTNSSGKGLASRLSHKWKVLKEFNCTPQLKTNSCQAEWRAVPIVMGMACVSGPWMLLEVGTSELRSDLHEVWRKGAVICAERSILERLQIGREHEAGRGTKAGRQEGVSGQGYVVYIHQDEGKAGRPCRSLGTVQCSWWVGVLKILSRPLLCRVRKE